MKKSLVVLVALAGLRGLALEVVEKDGIFSVVRDGTAVVTGIAVDRGDVGSDDVKTSFATLSDGTKVWNRWSEVRDRRFRLEVAQRADGAVEISMSAQMEPSSKCRRRFLDLMLPEAVYRGKSFEAVTENVVRFVREKGVFDASFKPGLWRWMSAAGLTFDFNPLGPGDTWGNQPSAEGWAHHDAVYGNAQATACDGGWSVRSGSDVKSTYGGFAGAKIVIREGGFDDYYRHHLIRTFHYGWPIAPVRLLAFGSPVRGPDYAEGNLPYLGSRAYGWIEDIPQGTPPRRAVVGHREGAYYSCLRSNRDATYRFSGLVDGHYLLTFSAGNYTGVANRFSVTAGGEALLADASVASGMVRKVTRAVHVCGGTLDVTFAGNWLLSVLALQPVLADGEDFSVCRGFWVSRGYEPAVIFRSDDWMPFKPETSDQVRGLPVPGTEYAGEPHDPPMPVELPDPNAPKLAWMKSARIHRIFNNSSTLAELDDPAEREPYLDGVLSNKNANAVMLSGLLSRHTQPARQPGTVKSVGLIAESLHRRGIKVFDHIDATLMWNCGFGFRQMLERPDELLLTWNDNMPSYQTCISNPAWRERFFSYLREVLSTGVDALQIDELYHWYKGCTCRHCCEKFRRETGWQVPLNECDPAWGDASSPFRRRWRDWRIKDCTNWFVELRRRTKDINPCLVLSAYSYTGGFVSSVSGDVGQELLDLSRAVNFFGIEVMSRSVMRSARAEVPFRRAQNILTFAYGAPVWDWYYTFDWQSDYVAWGMSTLTGQSPMLSEVKREEDTPDYAGFDVRRGAMDRQGATAVAPVGLLFSSHTRDLNAVPAWQPSLFGIAQALEALHVPYAFVPDVNVTPERLKPYRVLILSGVECLTAADEALLAAYEKNGGRIVRGIPGAADFCQPELVSLPASIDREVFRFNPDPAAERAFRARVEEAVGDAAGGWRITAPDRVATSVWREKSGAYAIHFLNLTGAINKVGETLGRYAPDPAFPSIAEDIVVTLPADEKIATAVAVSPDFVGERPLAVVRNADGTSTVVLPKCQLKVYTLIRMRQ